MISVFENYLIWFGCAVSVSEILTGTYFSSLGFGKGLLAILIGHLIGGAMLFAAGLIGSKSSKNAMEGTKMSFGSEGGKFFALLNVIQLVGWTGILLYDASLSVREIFSGSWADARVWAVIMGALMIVWVIIGISNLKKINIFAVMALFILTVVLSIRIFGSGHTAFVPLASEKGLSFGAAVELAAAMPLSWIPVISDFTSKSEKPVASALASTIAYSIASFWMYTIGLGASLFTGESNIALVFAKSGLGIAGLAVIVFSTVTTNFIAVHSAGISTTAIFPKVNPKAISVAATILGTAGAVFLPLLNIEGFLFFIGSVFTPMIGVLATDFFILKTDKSVQKFSAEKLLCWAAGFAFYRFTMNLPFPLGVSLADFLITVAITVTVHFAARALRKN